MNNIYYKKIIFVNVLNKNTLYYPMLKFDPFTKDEFRKEKYIQKYLKISKLAY